MGWDVCTLPAPPCPGGALRRVTLARWFSRPEGIPPRRILIFIPASFAVIFPDGWLLGDSNSPGGEFFKETGFVAGEDRKKQEDPDKENCCRDPHSRRSNHRDELIRAE